MITLILAVVALAYTCASLALSRIDPEISAFEEGSNPSVSINVITGREKASAKLTSLAIFTVSSAVSFPFTQTYATVCQSRLPITVLAESPKSLYNSILFSFDDIAFINSTPDREEVIFTSSEFS